MADQGKHILTSTTDTIPASLTDGRKVTRMNVIMGEGEREFMAYRSLCQRALADGYDAVVQVRLVHVNEDTRSRWVAYGTAIAW